MAQAAEPMAESKWARNRPRILVADGHPGMRDYLTRVLNEHHYDVDAAADASTALSLALERAPDLIVADLMMRTSSDFARLRGLRRDAWAEVPIILYSTSEAEADPGAGADDEVIAPFSERQLLALAKAHVKVTQIRQESLQSLRLAEDSFRTLKTMITPGVWLASPDGEIISELGWWWEEMTGQTPEQYAGLGWQDVVHPADRPHVIEAWQEAVRKKHANQIEYRVRRRNGSYSHVRSQGAPVRDGDGNVRGWVGTLIDIDDQERAEEALRTSEERHRTLIAMTALAVWYTAANGESIAIDLYRWTELTGQTPDEYRRLGWLNAIHPDDRERMFEIWQQALCDGKPFDVEFRVRRKDGTYRHVRDQGMALRNSDGSVREWVGTIVDIEDQKRVEEELRSREEELRANFEWGGVGQVQTDPKTGRYIRVNNRFCEMVGYSADELSTMTYLDLTHPDDRPEALNLLLGLLRGETNNYSTEKRYVHKDGSILWALITSTLIHDVRGKPLRTITMIEDVTERQQSEAISQSQKRALEMVAQGFSLPEVLDFVILAVEKLATGDLRGSILLLDDAGKEIRSCSAPSLPEGCRRALVTCWVSSQDEPCALSVFLKRPVIVSDLIGAPEWAKIANALSPYAIRSIWATPIISSTQKVLGSFCLYSSNPRIPSAVEQRIIENVTHTIALTIERKQAEAEREELLLRERASREQAEVANRVKDEFLAVVSHELRTPLNAINGWAYMLLGGTLEAAAQSRALQSIQRQVASQCQLIDDLLDVARIVSGKLRLELREIDPLMFVNAALEVVRPSAEAKQIDLAVKLDTAPMTVSADAERMQQVIWNLLSNAIKFTPRGGRVEIRSQRTDSSLEIVVADTGRGISGDFLPYVFERFRQADVSTTRTHGGIGLGLAIVRHFMDLHGGTVSVASAGKDKGATFTIRLPVVGVPASASAPGGTNQVPKALQDITAQRENLYGLRVLVVEDNSEDREVLFAELTHLGAVVSVFASAAEALAELDEFQPDVLVADIGMPGEDGYSLIRKIRARSPDHFGLTPAIALTAYAGHANRKRALEAGYQKHMTKPADPNELVRTIVRLARGQGNVSASSSGPVVAPSI